MVGLIAEYNPFHNGHKLHIERSKEVCGTNDCIVVMSGNFVQRGEPAIIDKYARTKMALLSGASLVIELPLIFATSSAELFAMGSIDILNKTGIVKNVCFGSEAGNLTEMKIISEILSNEPKEFKSLLKYNLGAGMSFPKARIEALQQFLNQDLEFLKEPNNILSIEYLKALNKTNSDIIPKTIKREGSSFHSTSINDEIISATAIRQFLKNGENIKNIKNAIPENCYEILQNCDYFPRLDDYSEVLSYILRTKNSQDLRAISEINEGIENRILNNSSVYPITSLLATIKSKRYTYVKLQRALLNIILDITKDDEHYFRKHLSPYIRVLGFRKNSNIIGKLAKSATVPVITNIKNAPNILDEKGMYLLQKEICSTDLHYMKKNYKVKAEYREPLVII